MPPSSNKPNQQQPPQKPGQSKNPSSLKVGSRLILSARAQIALSTILENIIDEALEEARKRAEGAGKHRVELMEVEGALKTLCERYHALWATEATPGKKPFPGTSGTKK